MKRLTLLLLSAMLLLPSMFARNYVLCVGLADYPGTTNDLHLSAHDAEVMQTLYQKNGYATVRIFMNQDATATAVATALSELCSQATSSDAVIFFFSGHGVPGAFVCYDTYLRYDNVVQALLSSAAGRKIIMADACFSGKARRNNRHTARQEGEAYRDKGVLFFLSSRTTETSIENRTMQNSLFTAFLERGLRGGADTNLDRTITARELFDFVSKGVKERSSDKQHPVMWGNFDNDMPLMKW